MRPSSVDSPLRQSIGFWGLIVIKGEQGWLLFNRAIDVPGFRDVLAWRKSNRAVNGAVKSISVRPKLNPQRSFAPAGGDAVRSGFIADG